MRTRTVESPGAARVRTIFEGKKKRRTIFFERLSPVPPAPRPLTREKWGTLLEHGPDTNDYGTETPSHDDKLATHWDLPGVATLCGPCRQCRECWRGEHRGSWLVPILTSPRSDSMQPSFLTEPPMLAEPCPVRRQCCHTPRKVTRLAAEALRVAQPALFWNSTIWPFSGVWRNK